MNLAGVLNGQQSPLEGRVPGPDVYPSERRARLREALAPEPIPAAGELWWLNQPPGALGGTVISVFRRDGRTLWRVDVNFIEPGKGVWDVERTALVMPIGGRGGFP
jgi:hypothetical protein